MKLTPKEFKILSACDTEADLSIGTIAKRVGSPEHVVQRVLLLLQREGAIRRRAYMNSFLVGTIPYLIALSLNPEGRKHNKKLESYLSKREEVSYVAQITGKYQIFVEVRFHSVHQIQSFLDDLSTECGNIFLKKEVLSLTAMYDFPVFAGGSQRPKLKEFETFISDNTAKLDKLDCKILKELAKDWSEANSQIARRLNMPVTTFDYHLKRMRKEGVMLGARYFVNLSTLGYHTFYHVLSMKGFHPSIRKKMVEFARKHDNVHCLRVFLGAWDFMFECHYENASQSLDFTEQLADKYGADISNLETYAVVGLNKISDCTIHLAV